MYFMVSVLHNEIIPRLMVDKMQQRIIELQSEVNALTTKLANNKCQRDYK